MTLNFLFAQTPDFMSFGEFVTMILFVVVFAFLFFLAPMIAFLCFRDYVLARGVRAIEKRYFQRVKELAENGDPEATYDLASYEPAGGVTLCERVDFDTENASDWTVKFSFSEASSTFWTETFRSKLVKAGEAGSLRAKESLADRLWFQRDWKSGELMLELTEYEVPGALCTIGVELQQDGKRLQMQRDPASAAQYFARAAKRNDAFGEFLLADCYRQGLGVERDEKRAAQLYERVIAKSRYDVYGAKRQLGELLLTGNGSEAERERGARLLVESEPYETIQTLIRESERDDPYALWALGTQLIKSSDDRHKSESSGRIYTRKDAESLFLQAAQLGAVVAMRSLGEYYKRRKEWERAEYWYNRGIERDDVSSAVSLIDLILSERACASDAQRAIEILSRAAEEQDGRAATALGRLRALGKLLSQNAEEAFRFFKIGAEQGNVDAMAKLGIFYASGTGTAQNFSEAVRWLAQAAFQNDKAALYALEKLANENRLANASRAVGVYRLRQSYGSSALIFWALRSLRQATEWGDARAMALLGDAITLNVVRKRRGVRKLREAAEWYRRAAELGEARAMKALGDYCQYGLGREIDEIQAAKHYENASELGNADAMFELARFYYRGLGVPKDVEKAREYAKRARETGNRDAQEWLNLYEFYPKPRTQPD
ncbi:MAG: SEL1-like repeat protein [Thermoguttaceae bacterium]|nr:SEL1-like repeat protein [Thermoguttaceae bacterium]